MQCSRLSLSNSKRQKHDIPASGIESVETECERVFAVSKTNLPISTEQILWERQHHPSSSEEER